MIQKQKHFSKRLSDGVIGQGALEPFVTVPDFDASTVLKTITANPKGIIDDTKGSGSSGIQGLVLVVDYFSPRGLGYGPYYYTIQPALLRVDQVSGLFGSFLDTKKITGDRNGIWSRSHSKNYWLDRVIIQKIKQPCSKKSRALFKNMVQMVFLIIQKRAH